MKQRREQVLTLYASGKGKTKEEKSVRTKSEQRYYNNILKVIKMCLQSRDFKGAVDNIKMLKIQGLSQSKVAKELSIGIATVKRYWNL